MGLSSSSFAGGPPQLKPRALLVVHAIIWIAVMYFVRAWPVIVGRMRVLPEPVDCMAAMVYQHRLQRGAATRVSRFAAGAYQTLGTWPQLLAGTRLLGTTGVATARTSGDQRAVKRRGSGNCFGFDSNASWAPLLGMEQLLVVPTVEVGPPSELCIAMCSAYLVSDAWLGTELRVVDAAQWEMPASWLSASASDGSVASATSVTKVVDGQWVTITEKRVKNNWGKSKTEITTRRVGLVDDARGSALGILAAVDAVLALVGAGWVLAAAVGVEQAWRFAPEAEYLAWGPPVRQGLRTLASMQVMLGICHGVVFSSLTLPAAMGFDSLLTLLCICMALQVAEHALALLALALLGALWWSLSWMVAPCCALVRVGTRFAWMLLTESVLKCEPELSLESSCSFGEDDSCAICLCTLHPEAASLPPPGRTSLERLRPRFRSAASMAASRTRLVRLPCGHAFHDSCFRSLEEVASHQSRYACPTCRASSEHRVWRKRRPHPSQLLDFFRTEPDCELLLAVCIMAALMFAFLLGLEVMVRLAELWVDWHLKLHETYGISKPLLQTPVNICFIFNFLLKLHVKWPQALVISLVMAYPVAYLIWAVPNLLVFGGLIAALAIVLQM